MPLSIMKSISKKFRIKNILPKREPKVDTKGKKKREESMYVCSHQSQLPPPKIKVSKPSDRKKVPPLPNLVPSPNHLSPPIQFSARDTRNGLYSNTLGLSHLSTQLNDLEKNMEMTAANLALITSITDHLKQCGLVTEIQCGDPRPSSSRAPPSFVTRMPQNPMLDHLAAAANGYHSRPSNAL